MEEENTKWKKIKIYYNIALSIFNLNIFIVVVFNFFFGILINIISITIKIAITMWILVIRLKEVIYLLIKKMIKKKVY